MKRIAIWTTVGVVLFLAVFVVVRAEARGRHGWCGHRWHHPGPAAWLARDLNLDHGQKEKIHALWEAERPAIAADVHQLLAENKEMNATTAQGNSDPGKVQAIADREAATIASLLVEKQRLQEKVYSTVLTPEQRTKADAMQKKWESRLDRAAERLGTQSSPR